MHGYVGGESATEDCDSVHPEFRSAAQVRKDLLDVFPRLADVQWRVKSPFDRTYKCIAWAACRTDHIWWPHEDDPLPKGIYWPPGIPRNRKVETFVQAFERLGYRPCGKDSSFEFGYQKVAIYAWNPDFVTHMARQHFLGNLDGHRKTGHAWTSENRPCEVA